MIPFRIFDRDKKELWVVLSFEAMPKGGRYLVAREDDTSENDGAMSFIMSDDLERYRFVEFLTQEEP